MMQHYRITFRPHPPAHVREQISPLVVGTDIIVEAIDERSARELARVNYAVGGPTNGSTTGGPLEADAVECSPLRGTVPPPRMFMLADQDLAPELVNEMALVRDDEVVARMHWWPCRPGETCPG